MQRDRRPAQRARTMWLLWSQGYSKSAIGRAFGVSSEMVGRVLARYGYEQRVGVGRIRDTQHNVELDKR